jgi:hypothetical protein
MRPDEPPRYEHCDIPAGVTLAEYRRERARAAARRPERTGIGRWLKTRKRREAQ